MFSPASKLKSNFPLLAVSKPPFAYLDNAATTQKPESVITAVDSFYRTMNSNIHRGVYPLSEKATAAFESARKTVAHFLNARADEIIFTSGATASLNELALSLELQFSKEDAILISEADHHSNILPWLRLAERRGCKIHWISVNEEGTLDLNNAEKIIQAEPVKLVALSSVSHVLGNRHSLKTLFACAREKGAITVVDATQAVARERINVETLGCDALAFSGHKLYAPTGVGVLYANRTLQARMTPAFVGGGMVNHISKDGSFSSRQAPWKFEAGTPAIEAAVGLKAAIEFVEQNTLFEHAVSEKALIERFALFLAKQPGVSLLGWASQLQKESAETTKTLPAHEGILSFTMDGLHPHDLAQTLADEGIAVRAGHHCAQLLTDKLAPNGCVRISLAASNDEADLELFKTAFEKCLALRNELQTV